MFRNPEVTLNYNTDPGHQRIAEALAQGYKEAGFTVKLANYEWGAFNDKLFKGELEFWRSGWGADYPLMDNTRFTWADVDVDPRLRRRGAGGALVEQLVGRTREEGRSTVLVESHVPDTGRVDHPHVRFAERTVHLGQHRDRRLLDLPLDQVRLGGLATEAARRHEGYRVESYVGLLPESLQQSYCDCSNLLGVDAPTGAVDFEAESLTPPPTSSSGSA